MSVRDLVVLYVLTGLVCGVLAYRRSPGVGFVGTSIATGLLWPLLAPFFVVGSGRLGTTHDAARCSTEVKHPAVERVIVALDGGLEAAADTPFAAIFTAAMAEKFERAAVHAGARLAELEAAIAVSEQAYPSAHSVSPVKHAASARLGALHQQTAAQLTELAELLEELRCRLLLARFEDQPHDEVSELIAEARAHVEALG